MSADTSFWNVRPAAHSRQLILFPFLGGFGASFNGLVNGLRSGWDIWTANPPGHGPSTIAPIDSLDELVAHYVDELDDVLRPGAVLFGHSMGGIIAYHVLAALQQDARFGPNRIPADLILSAVRAPMRLAEDLWSQASDRDLITHLIEFGALPGLIAADPDLIGLFVPAFRADYGVLEDARRRPISKLDVRARLVLGELDPQTPSGTADDWQRYFWRPLRTHTLPGEEHMFVRHAIEPIDAILAEVRETPAEMIPPMSHALLQK